MPQLWKLLSALVHVHVYLGWTVKNGTYPLRSRITLMDDQVSSSQANPSRWWLYEVNPSRWWFYEANPSRWWLYEANPSRWWLYQADPSRRWLKGCHNSTLASITINFQDQWSRIWGRRRNLCGRGHRIHDKLILGLQQCLSFAMDIILLLLPQSMRNDHYIVLAVKKKRVWG